MSDSLARLLKIRKFRELTAGIQVHECQAQFQRCLQQQQQQKVQWKQYRCWRLRREQLLFKTLQNKPASSRELDGYRAELVALRQRENLLATELRQTQQTLENASQNLANARLKLRKVTKAKEKLSVYLTICDSAAKHHQEYREERQQEEDNLCSKAMLVCAEQ